MKLTLRKIRSYEMDSATACWVSTLPDERIISSVSGAGMVNSFTKTRGVLHKERIQSFYQKGAAAVRLLDVKTYWR